MAWMCCQAVVIFFCPGPGGGDFQGSAATAADEAGGGVQDAVAQGLRLRFCQVAVQGQESFSQASRMQAIMAASSHALFSP